MGTKKVTITHKRNDCIGCGSCACIAPQTWTMNVSDGKSDMKNGAWKGKQFVVGNIETKEDREKNREAEKACPVHIIRVHTPK